METQTTDLVVDEIDPLADQVLEVLTKARTLNQRITGARIALVLGHRNTRQIRRAIRRLIERGEPVAMSVHAPFGYYLVSELDEAKVCEAALRSYAMRILERLRDFRKAVNVKFGPAHQLPLQGLDDMLEELQ